MTGQENGITKRQNLIQQRMSAMFTTLFCQKRATMDFKQRN